MIAWPDLALHAAAEKLESENDVARAIDLIAEQHIQSALHPTLITDPSDIPVGRGIPAAPGACSGMLCTNLDSAQRCYRRGLPVVYCSESPNPDAMRAIAFADGMVFRTAGATSHVAVIVRGLGKPCVLGVAQLTFADPPDTITIGRRTIQQGSWISVDGFDGTVFIGKHEVKTARPELQSPLSRILAKCGHDSSMAVHVNADNEAEALEGIEYGASGIGLCRVEHVLAEPSALHHLVRALSGVGRALNGYHKRIYDSLDTGGARC